jgi:hypothetical protein
MPNSRWLMATLCLLSLPLWAQAQTQATQMHFVPGSFLSPRTWSIGHQGKSYREFSAKPARIAQECGCPEASALFKKARKQYGSAYVFAFGGVVTGTGLSILLYDNDEAQQVVPLVMSTIILSGYIPLWKSAKTARQAVYEFNGCLEKEKTEQPR